MTAIRRLSLSDFRNHAGLDLEADASLIALVGDNGVGKTNILEAISILSPGRGLRRAEFADMVRIGARAGFAVSTEIATASGDVRLGAGFDPRQDGGRRCRIDREPVASASAFADYCRVIWLTPDNDGLFRGGAGDRRRFLDRLVLAVDSAHGARVAAMEKSLRARNRVLEEPRPDAQWLDAIEHELAQTAIAVAAARRETVARLVDVIDRDRRDDSAFPFACLAIEGEIDQIVANGSALAAEEWYRRSLRDNRYRDQAAGRTLIGPNASDLVVRHGPKDLPAASCSTGEQKALLIGLVLAHARLVRMMSGLAPLVLLDEVAAHLDPTRRSALYAGLARIGSQVWMTGTDAALFSGMPDSSQIVRIGAERPLTRAI